MLVAASILGVALVLFVLWDAFETIVLPRRPRRGFRITRTFYRATWRPWRFIACWLSTRNKKRHETFLSLFGPLSLLMLLMTWALGLILGFAVLHWSAGTHLGGSTVGGFAEDLYFSGSTFFTLGMGDVTPNNNVARLLAVLEAGMGFAFLAIMIGYLPVIYQSFSRREVSISLLDARAGTPPTALELLRRHGDHIEELGRLLEGWEQWSAELLESHMSYPVLAYFRSQHDNQSWLGALTAVLDSCALCMAGFYDGPSRQARLTFAMARHALVDLAQVFNTPPLHDHDRLTPASMEELHGMVQQCVECQNAPSADELTRRLHELRAMYEPYAAALGQFLLIELPPWVRHDHAPKDNWETSRWGRDTVV